MIQRFFLIKNLQYLASLVLMLFSINLIAAVQAPELRCLSVNNSGESTILWVSPSDPNGEFRQYTVYVATSITGPYSPNVVNNISTTQFTDIVNDAGLGVVYFYIQTEYDDGSGIQSSAPSDTAQTILPIFSAATDSTNTFDWNPVFNPDNVTSLGVYSIFRRIGVVGAFTQIGTTNYGNETYDDSFKVCSDSIFYRIEIADNSGCVSTSAVLEDLFEDNTPPKTPFFDSLTVDPILNQVNLGWSPSTSLDTKGYIVFYWTKATSSYRIQDTLWGINNTFYQEPLTIIDPKFESEQFTITAFDSCFDPNANTSVSADPQKTIHLKVIPNNCENTVSLIWTPYINWPDIDGYEILVSISGDPYFVATTVPATDTSFTHQKTNDLELFCYKIRAVAKNRSRTSSSNVKCALANSLVIPAKQHFKQVTVVDNDYIHISSLTDTTLPATEYVLYRSLERFENFFEVLRMPFENSSVIEMDDFETSVDQTSYYFRIGIIDTCGSLMFISKPGNSIFLEGSMSDDSLQVTLNWNDYIGWDTVGSGVDKYMVYMVVDGNRIAVDSVDRFTTTYSYQFLDDITLGANYCFEIEAREGIGNKFNMRDTALSNSVCFTKNLNVYVPNAFRPGGANPIFKPVISFGEISTYSMVVYDRWGYQVFETNDVFNGWDGKTDGNDAEFGAYVYVINISNFTGSTYQKSGTFVLLR